MSIQKLKTRNLATLTLVEALALSNKSRDQLNQIFGTKAAPMSFSGRAESGDESHTWTSYYDNGLIHVTSSGGNHITGTPGDIEMFMSGLLVNAVDAGKGRGGPRNKT